MMPDVKEIVSMKHACRRLFVAAVVVLSAQAAMAQAPNLTGNWKMDFVTDQGPMPAALTLKQEGTKVTGDITSDQGSLPVSGTFVDGKLELTASLDACGMSLIITLKAAFEKDVLKGDADFGGFGTATWTAARAK
jgi:hypothetical protein